MESFEQKSESLSQRPKEKLDQHFLNKQNEKFDRKQKKRILLHLIPFQFAHNGCERCVGRELHFTVTSSIVSY